MKNNTQIKKFKKHLVENFDTVFYSLSENDQLQILNHFRSIAKSNDVLKVKLRQGDYVEYNGNSNYHGLWQVLYDGTSEINGKRIEIVSCGVTEKVQIGSEHKLNPNKRDVAIAKTAYANLIRRLNLKTSKYINRDFARDSRCIGSSVKDKDLYGRISKELITFNPFKTPFIIMSKLLELEQEHHSIDLQALYKIKAKNIQNSYWVASRSVDAQSSRCSFNVRFIDSCGSTKSQSLYCKSIYKEILTSGGNYGLRPVITLKKSVKIIDGFGTEKAPYILG